MQLVRSRGKRKSVYACLPPWKRLMRLVRSRGKHKSVYFNNFLPAFRRGSSFAPVSQGSLGAWLRVVMEVHEAQREEGPAGKPSVAPPLP
jgi:hypothetical protein